MAMVRRGTPAPDVALARTVAPGSDPTAVGPAGDDRGPSVGWATGAQTGWVEWDESKDPCGA
jgi:hypothetical protein